MRRDRGTRRRVPSLLLVVALVVIGLLAVRGPEWYRRFHHPLRYASLIVEQSSANDVDPYLVAAVINAESGFRPVVISKAGAVGLMQIKPSTARSVARGAGVRGEVTAEALTDPETNLRVGTRYLAYLVRRYDNDTTSALAAYNAGLSHADRWVREAREAGAPLGESIGFPETSRYVATVLEQREVYRDLYPDIAGAR